MISKILMKFNSLGSKELLNWLPDETYLKILYRIRMGKRLNLKNPKTYSEKLQWLKLYNRNSLYTKLVDKYEVKKYVASIIGEQYIIPSLGIYDSFDDIDFERLPEQFVLKCTHDSGGIVICKDKKKYDIEAARLKLEKHLKHSYYWGAREWPYKNVKPRIIAEKYIEDSSTVELRDYKLFCFSGEVKMLFIATDRQKTDTQTTFDFFDSNYKHLDIRNGHPNASQLPSKPHNFEKMKELATVLSQNIPQVRIDFYEADGMVYFGEMTFFHHSGMVPFEPEKWDSIIGEWIRLPNKRSMSLGRHL